MTVFKPNIKETEEALAVKISNEQDLIAAGYTLKEKLQAESILITRGLEGMSLFEGEQKVTHVPARARKVADVSGAGDTVISTLTAGLAGDFFSRFVFFLETISPHRSIWDATALERRPAHGHASPLDQGRVCLVNRL